MVSEATFFPGLFKAGRGCGAPGEVVQGGYKEDLGPGAVAHTGNPSMLGDQGGWID